jgi:mono/diheme cytochrome c family protein
MPGSLQAALIGTTVLAGVGGLLYVSARNIVSAGPAAAQPVADTTPGDDALALQRQRGAYLMATLDCNACHTAHDGRGQPIPGGELAGHPADAPLPEWDPSLMERNIAVSIAPTFTAFAGPFGLSVAPNLTPDKETGIGNLTADALIKSWRTGKHWKHDRPVMPPMPIPAYTNLTDEDIRALHAFLMSLPPVRNKAPESRPAPMPG